MFQINGDKPDFIAKKKGNFTFLKILYINHCVAKSKYLTKLFWDISHKECLGHISP